ncbi:hypothetical protein [Kineococcus auxinigenes]|uniref:hypothetical protein n=1 Tax=unclassified Kineococcus TaxID=2621656 RepID=UPI003D7DA88E
MGVINAVGPMAVALVVVVLPLLVAAARRSWNRWAVGLYLLSLVLLAVWTAKSVVIADSSFDEPPAWPALPWMLATLLTAGATTASLLSLRARSRTRLPAG